MIIARIESLILKKGMNDALKRAFSYVKAGADGIMIHSSQKILQKYLNSQNYLKRNIRISLWSVFLPLIAL